MRATEQQILQKEDQIISQQTYEVKLLQITLIVATVHAIMYIPSLIYYVRELLK